MPSSATPSSSDIYFDPQEWFADDLMDAYASDGEDGLVMELRRQNLEETDLPLPTRALCQVAVLAIDWAYGIESRMADDADAKLEREQADGTTGPVFLM